MGTLFCQSSDTFDKLLPEARKMTAAPLKPWSAARVGGAIISDDINGFNISRRWSSMLFLKII
jgi:hypothetical protein